MPRYSQQTEKSELDIRPFRETPTAEIKRVTLVRNEENYQHWEPKAKLIAESFEDKSPVAGENRYYLRIEQADGNMTWSSPVWVQVK